MANKKKTIPKDINQLAAYIVAESIKESESDNPKIDKGKKG